ncbi:unnamed protein product [Microthlaspi erraticum]|uniref:Uncharacterized protein n=1 Tax=Microthlaspi erraticum TaxID=1685480 RepID=A0A6D2KGT4_9BRAS|nr:unnamed protein product [Microthlaspi erraticum]
METVKAIEKAICRFLTNLVTVFSFLDGVVGDLEVSIHYLSVIPTSNSSIRREAVSTEVIGRGFLYKWRSRVPSIPSSSTNISSLLYYPFRYYEIISKMADNLRRQIQDLDLGAHDEPVLLPVDFVEQAAAENRFILIGRPTMPRRQNLRSLIAVLPGSGTNQRSMAA